MCSTSRMVPVRLLAGIASARRMLSGNAANVAAAMPVVAVPCRNLRRAFMFRSPWYGLTER